MEEIILGEYFKKWKDQFHSNKKGSKIMVLREMRKLRIMKDLKQLR
jgi:hypothetical protein